MISFLTVVHLVICVLIVALVLLQFGKGAEQGGILSSTSGASQNIFSTSSQGNILTKTTAVLATGFFITTFLLSTLQAKKAKQSLLDKDPSAINIQLNNDKAAVPAPAASASTSAAAPAASSTATATATATSGKN